MVLYTECYQDEFRASECADLKQFDDINDIKRHVIERSSSLNCSDLEVCGIRQVAFSGAWIKSYHDPRDFEKEAWMEEAGELRIYNPGSHSGGYAWWVEPASPVFIPVFKVLDDGEWVYPEGYYIKLD